MTKYATPGSSKHPDKDNTKTDTPHEAYQYPTADEYTDRIFETMQVSAIFFDAEGIIYRTNTLARKDLQTTQDPVGQPIVNLIAVIDNATNILPELLSQLNVPGTEQVKLPPNVFIRRHEGRIQFFITGSLLRLQGGYYLFTFRNTTEEITRDHIYSMVLARTRIFPWFYDMERNKMLIDAHWFAYLGIPAGDCMITNEEFFARVHPDERQMLAEALARQLSEQEIPDTFAYRLQRGDGSWEWFSEQSMYLSKTSDGSPYRIVGVCQSIQDHKTIEENLRSARNKAQESDRLKSAFLANMSHEIRTPLNAIVGFSDLLTNGSVEPTKAEAQEYAKLISKNCDDLLTLVSDVLDLSRIETETIEFNFEEYSLQPFLTEIYNTYIDKISPTIKFNLLFPPDELKSRTDVVRLRQVMSYLLDNAIKFTENGHIDLGYIPSNGGESVCLFVADSGRGIPADQISQIFERFYKVDSFTQGAGLGLSICKTLVEGIGGTINVSSHPGKGSRFSISLPVKPHEKNLLDNSSNDE